MDWWPAARGDVLNEVDEASSSYPPSLAVAELEVVRRLGGILEGLLPDVLLP